MPQPHGESNRKTCRWVVTIRLAFKLTLKPNVKIIAHGSALRHIPDTTDMWEGSPAYTGPTPRKLPAGKPLQDAAQHWSEVEAFWHPARYAFLSEAGEGRETTCNIAGPTLFARWKPLCLSAVSSSTR